MVLTGRSVAETTTHLRQEALGYVPPAEVTLPALAATKIDLGPRTVDLYHPAQAEAMMVRRGDTRSPDTFLIVERS